ncbi:MAG: hydrogenase maturation nickel metallochaperone HypA [Bacillota bacterium]|nr:hydrogenase maturation nickel metallochaperone HypA [Bacillota bacterium]
MHELAVTESIIRICCEEANRHKVQRVLEVRLEVGELKGLIPDCIQYYFDIASKGTPAEGARLIINKIPITMRCRNCGEESEAAPSINFTCRNCGGKDFKMVKGNEFLIQSLEVE